MPDSHRGSLPADRRDVLDCVVVGAGPAGLTAGLYLRRFLRNVRVIDAGGARARRISRSNNVAGFPDGISGEQLLARMARHLEKAGGLVLPGQVHQLQKSADGLFAAGLGEHTLWARRVILCTGVKDRLPQVQGAGEVEAADLLRHCPICDGYEHRDRRIAVLGNSAHGVREAAFLQTFSRRVSFVGVGACAEELGPDLHAAGVQALPGGVARLAVGHDREVLVTTEDGAEHRFDVLYAALGVDPCASLAGSLGAQLDAKGNIVTDAHGRTSVENLYAAGDVVSALDQIAVAVGQAVIAATAIHNSL